MSEQELVEREVLAELAQGHWPTCFSCQRSDQVSYFGMVAGSPTFACARCSAVFAMDLVYGPSREDDDD